MRKYLRVFLACWLSLSIAFSGCAVQRARYRIAVIPKGTTHQHWQSVHAGAQKAAKERGDVEILWEGPSKEDQKEKQQEIVERFTAQGVNAIVLAPCDRRTLVEPTAAALKKDIFVVLIDSGLEKSDDVYKHKKYLGYVATDNEKGGKLAAERMAELFKGQQAEIVMIPYQAGSESTELRERGFKNQLANYKNLKLTINEEEAGATVESAQKAAENLLRRPADGIFAPNESSAAGVLQAILSQKDKVGKIKLVGFDGSNVLIEGIKAGNVHGLVLQDPFEMGYKSVMRAIDALHGTMPAADAMEVHTNIAVATAENVEAPNLRAMYAPDLQKYLPK